MLIIKQINENSAYQEKIAKLIPGQRYFVATELAYDIHSVIVKRIWVECTFRCLTGKNNRVLLFDRHYLSSTKELHKSTLTIDTLSYLFNENPILTPKEFYEAKERMDKEIEKVIYDIKLEKEKK